MSLMDYRGTARSSVYTFCPSVLSTSILKLHKTLAMDNTLIHEKLLPRFTFNPGFNQLSNNPARKQLESLHDLTADLSKLCAYAFGNERLINKGTIYVRLCP